MEIRIQKTSSYRPHNSAVIFCLWNPTLNNIASASNDRSACILDLNMVNNISSDTNVIHNISNNITALAWNDFGTILATTSLDRYTRLWKKDGAPLYSFQQKGCPIYLMKWNKNGNFIANVGIDNAIRIYDIRSKRCIQKFSFHKNAISDIDWMSKNCFASCGIDHDIFVCQIDTEHKIRTFVGHTDEVNVIKWNPQGRLLASGSKDTSIKIWSMKHNNCVQSFHGHRGEIHTIQWSPTGPDTINPNKDLILASGSHDSTVRLWDFERGVNIQTLKKHTKPINNVAFSPDAKLLASGSYDKCIKIWSTQSGKLLHSYKAKSVILKVGWNFEGNRVAASASDGSIYIFDIRML